MKGTESPTTLYRLRDATGRLLYVGIAGNPGRRFEQHAKEKAWWGDVASTHHEHFATRSEALDAERRAIQIEEPLYNVIHNARPVTTPQFTSLHEVVIWKAWCRGCDPVVDGSTYWFDVERISTLSDALDWNAHLLEKRWIEFTNWTRMLARLPAGDGLLRFASTHGGRR